MPIAPLRGTLVPMRTVVLVVLIGLAGCDCGDDGPDPPECAEGEVACGRECVLPDEDPEHCGACDVTCEEAQVCHASACRDECPAGLSECGRTCRALGTDPLNCGTCDVECGTGEVCERGTCACPERLTRCDDGCVDTATDPARCGTCDGTCEEGETCVGGVCGCATERRETTCDNRTDDDCDGLVDCEDPECGGSVVGCEGDCGAGIRRCDGDVRGACIEGDGGPEVCGNGIDDDCDGESSNAPDPLEPTDACEECYRLGTPDIRFDVFAKIDSVFDAFDCYVFDAVDDSAYAERIDVALEDIPDDVDLDLHLYRGLEACEARTPLASSTAGPGENEALSFVETLDRDDSGTYYIRVVRVSGASCDVQYHLSKDGLD